MKYLLSILLFFLAFAGYSQTVPQVNNVPWYEFTRKLSVGQRFAPPRDTLSYPPGAINRDTTGLLAFASNGNLYKLWNGTWSLIGGGGSDVEIIGDSAIVVGDDTLFVKNTVVETDLDPSYAMQDGDTVRLYFRQYAMDSLYIRHNGDTLFMPNGDTLYLNRIASTGYAITGNGTSGSPLALDTSQLYNASASNRGIVSLGDQVMGKGKKSFDSVAVINSGSELWKVKSNLGYPGMFGTPSVVWDEVVSANNYGTMRQFVENGYVRMSFDGFGINIFPNGALPSTNPMVYHPRLNSANPVVRLRDKAGMSLSVGTTDERQTAYTDTGILRFNTDSMRLEVSTIGGGGYRSLAWAGEGGGGSGVTSITAGLGLTGGTITSSGTIGVDTAALSGAYIKNQYASKESKDAWIQRLMADTVRSGLFIARGSGTSVGVVAQRDQGTAPLNGAAIGSYISGGYNGTNYTTSNRGGMRMFASEDWTGSANGTSTYFYRTPNGSTTELASMRIFENGMVGFNSKGSQLGSIDSLGRASIYLQYSKGNTSSTNAMLLRDSAGVDLFKVDDAGNVNIKGILTVTGNYGTRANRPTSGTIGQRYYQTDGYFGNYTWNGDYWNPDLDDDVVSHHKAVNSGNGLTANTAGGGAFAASNAGGLANYTLSATNPGGNATVMTGFSNHGANYIISQRVIASLSNLSTGTERYYVRIGTVRTGGEQVQNGSYFEYSDSLNSGNWVCVTSSSSVETRTNTSVAATSGGGGVEFVITQYGTDSVAFYINGVRVAGHTTNIPTTTYSTSEPMASVMIYKTQGSTIRSVRIRQMAMKRKETNKPG